MYRIKVKRSFSSAHRLRGYKGKCENLHGHNWDVEVTAGSFRLDKLGMVLDFGDLKKIVDDVIVGLDHICLNDHPYFKKINPSSESLSRFFFDQVRKRLPRGVKLFEVAIAETPNNVAVYTPS